MTHAIDTNESRARHRAAIKFGTFTDTDGRRVRTGYRYTCPRCGWISRTLRHRIGAEYHADRHALVCAAGKPEPRQMTPCVVMDYPTAWAYVRSRALNRGIGEHDPRCSFRQTNGAILCDCAVLNDEYDRRKLAAEAGRPIPEPARDDTDAVRHA